MPPSMPPIFCLVSSSTFFTASLQAATTISCSIATSPATPGSIFTASTFLWPCIFHVPIPPPAEASTRMRATSCCMRSCICCACFIMFCMLPGSFTYLLLQIANRSNLPAEYFLKFLHFRIGQRSRRSLVLGRLLRLRRSRRRRALSGDDLDLQRTPHNAPHRLVQVVRIHAEQELFRRGELQLVSGSGHCRVLNAVRRKLHADLHEGGMQALFPVQVGCWLLVGGCWLNWW